MFEIIPGASFSQEVAIVQLDEAVINQKIEEKKSEGFLVGTVLPYPPNKIVLLFTKIESFAGV